MSNAPPLISRLTPFAVTACVEVIRSGAGFVSVTATRSAVVFLRACGAFLAGVFLVSAYAAPVVSPNLLLLAGAIHGPDIVVVGERGRILYSQDNAATWERAAVALPPGSAPTLTGIAFASSTKDGWAVGHDALILITHDGGRSWQKSWQGENLTDSFLDVLALDARHVLAVGAYGLCLESTDAGQTWKRRKLIAEDRHLNRMTRGPDGTLYLAGERDTLLRSRNAGAEWTALSSPYEGSFFGLLALDERTLLAYGLRGRLYRSADAGESWIQIDTGSSGLIAAGLQLKKGPLVFAGQARTLALSRDLGRTATRWNAPLTTAVSALLELTDGRVLSLGEAGVTILPEP